MTHRAATTYRDAGVDIDAKAEAIQRARSLIVRTWGEHVMGEFGDYGGLFRVPKGLDEPILCASTDGVGTKIAIAVAANRHDTVGRDLVNHCANDILVQGARPLFLLDYIATGRIEKGVVEQILEGFSEGCLENHCALLGGETAEMPGTYKPGDYDLAATIVGVVEKRHLLPRRDAMKPGDVLVGLPSTGLHTNGYSLARKVLLEQAGHDVEDRPPELGGVSISDALLAVHRTYVALLHPLLPEGRIKGMAHITGGGFPDNVPRVLPPTVDAVIDASAWEPLPIFRYLRERGNVALDECYRVFNMGVGMVLVVAKEDVDPLLRSLERLKETGARVIGELTAGTGEVQMRLPGGA